jgi:hypothetical protein
MLAPVLFDDVIGASAAGDHACARVAAWWLRQPHASERIGDVLRRSFDEVLDGQRTGRFIYEEMANSEKTYVGTKVEILLREEFGLPRGPVPKRLDFDIEGVGVDCKYSQSTSWMIPVEAVGELCLLLTASDATTLFSLGVLRCSLELLNAPNRDLKRGVAKRGREAAVWLWVDEPMPENLLRRIPEIDRQAIFADQGSGQQRVNELFRRVHGRIVRREVTLTVARQDDSMKRARDARRHLQPEGILILGHQEQHPRIADELRLPIPRKGELVACRVLSARPSRLLQRRPTTVIGGAMWVLAQPGDPVEAGPMRY